MLAVDGAWSSWTWSGDCTVTCGGGTESETRTCTNPAPQNGGVDCCGNNTKGTRACNTQPCPPSM